MAGHFDARCGDAVMPSSGAIRRIGRVEVIKLTYVRKRFDKTGLTVTKGLALQHIVEKKEIGL